MANVCLHPNVTLHSRLVSVATLYEPAEYDQWVVCDECDTCGVLSDFTDSDISDEETVGRGYMGTPHEYYD